MADNGLLERVGLAHSVLFATQGAVAREHFLEILRLLREREPNMDTRKMMADQIYLWGVSLDASIKFELFRTHAPILFSTITTLGTMPNDGEDGASYKGEQHVPMKLAEVVQIVTATDTTQNLARDLAPAAFETANAIVDSGHPLVSGTPFLREGPGICRASAVRALLRIFPYAGKGPVIPIAVPLLVRLIKTGPKSIVDEAKSRFGSMSATGIENFHGHTASILELIAAGDNDSLAFLFGRDPHLYTDNVDAVHAQLDVFFRMPFVNAMPLITQVAQNNPQVLEPYIPNIMDVYREGGLTSTAVLGVLKSIAGVLPASIYPLVDEIEALAARNSNDLVAFAGLLGAVGKQNSSTADAMVPKLVQLLSTPGVAANISAVVLTEIMNLKDFYSSREVLTPYMDIIRSKRSVADANVQMVEDWFAGLSLAGLDARVDDLEARIEVLNSKVAEACTNFEEVKAYVDQNIAEVKEFLADVAKKLPTPKRLEITGRFRKSLYLHFECVHTGREYPVESKEWNKWLKIGFSIVKCGKGVLDAGLGNPLGIVSSGVDAVKEIYENFKSEDDDDFNTYITQPFLTSEEQDKLINQLRDQHFFDKFTYDAQVAGWYLINPDDGTLPRGETGTVTKNNQVVSVVAAAEVKGAEETKSSAGETVPSRSPMHEPKSPAAAAAATTTGAKAAARGSGGATTANAAVYADSAELRDAIQHLESRVTALEQELARVKANPPAAACCIVS